MKHKKKDYKLNFLRNAEVIELSHGFAVYSEFAGKEIFVSHFKRRSDAVQAINLTAKTLQAIGGNF